MAQITPARHLFHPNAQERIRERLQLRGIRQSLQRPREGLLLRNSIRMGRSHQESQSRRDNKNGSGGSCHHGSNSYNPR
jgi:hypothetical protein